MSLIRKETKTTDKPSNTVLAYKLFEKDSKFGDNCIFFRCDFEDNFSFGDNCEFTDYTKFGNNCKFGRNCKFGNACDFGDKCVFKEGCEFGNKPLFGDNCVMLQNNKVVKEFSLMI